MSGKAHLFVVLAEKFSIQIIGEYCVVEQLPRRSEPHGLS